MSLTTSVLTGESLAAALDDVARLRIAVFREWPYLYDGDLEYEREYMTAYQAPDAVVVVARDDARIVGAATGTPMQDHAEDFANAFSGRDEPLSDIFYCAESVLLPEYRGQGIGHAFFNAREVHARELGAKYSAFCSVIRPNDHPKHPTDYQPLDGFWRKRGFAPLSGVIAQFSWRDIGEAAQTEKPLQFWMKKL